MAINKIEGLILQDNLTRDTNLTIDTNLLVFDVTNKRIGINKTPTTDLDVLGNALVSNQLTAGTIVMLGSAITASAGDLAFNAAVGNISVSSKKIINCANPTTGTDVVNLNHLNTALGAFAQDQIISNNSSLTVVDAGTGTFAYVLDAVSVGTMSATLFNLTPSITTAGEIIALTGDIGQLNFDTNIITSDTGTIVLNDNVQIAGAATGANRLLFKNASDVVATSTNLTYNGTTLSLTGAFVVDNLTTDGNTVTSSAGLNLTTTNNDIVLTSGTGIVDIVATSSLKIPAGTTLQRPALPNAGYIRFNADTVTAEIYNGTAWSGFGADFAGITAQQILGVDLQATYGPLDSPSTTNSIIVSLNGIIQIPSTAYAVIGTNIVFTEALVSTDVVDIRFLSSLTTVAGLSDAPGTTSITTQAGVISMTASAIESARVDDNAVAGDTRFMLYDVTAGTLKRVSVGLADSGGTGYKVLRIPN